LLKQIYPKKIPSINKIILISCGRWHSLALNNIGLAFSTGYNKNGELGLGDTTNRYNFIQIQSLNNIVGLSGGTISLFISNGKLYSCGKGQLNGFSHGNEILIPTLINSFDNDLITNASSGFSHNSCVNSKGEIFTWGEGCDYQLGHGNKNRCQTPKKIENFNKIIIQVSCSVGEKHSHTGCVDNQGKVYTWGSGYKCKLGHVDQNDVFQPRQIEAIDNIRISKLVCGGIHSAVLTEDGKIMTFGCGSDGRLGHPESSKYRYLYKEKIPRLIENIKKEIAIDLSCSYYHCIAVCGNK